MMKKWYVSRNHFASLRKVEKYNDDEEARNRHLIYTHSVITNGLIVEPIFEYILLYQYHHYVLLVVVMLNMYMNERYAKQMMEKKTMQIKSNQYHSTIIIFYLSYV